jgi:hypothetical protein
MTSNETPPSAGEFFVPSLYDYFEVQKEIHYEKMVSSCGNWSTGRVGPVSGYNLFEVVMGKVSNYSG